MAIQNQLPAAILPDGANPAGGNRLDSYSEPYTALVTGKEFFTATEGSHFVAITPTPGTGIIGHAAPTTFDEAKPYIVVYNGHPTKSLYPQFLHLHETVASAIRSHAAQSRCDVGRTVPRRSLPLASPIGLSSNKMRVRLFYVLKLRLSAYCSVSTPPEIL